MNKTAEAVREQIIKARANVYRLFPATPLQAIDLSFAGVHTNVWIKREDLSPIHSFKWRGAFHCITQLAESSLAHGVVTASAGNHAQGVAATARYLGIHARIFMPSTTPLTKLEAVKKHGGNHVEIATAGDSYDESYGAALKYADRHRLSFVHPYDDAAVIGGQATVADELLRQMARHAPDAVYVPVGGGGLAAAIALWLKTSWPKTRVIGVEAWGQQCLSEALSHGAPVALSAVDNFCDGTAVRQAGTLCFDLCQKFLDEIVIVTNDEVCRAIGLLWKANRMIAEPAGALGAAGFLKQARAYEGKTVCCVLSGANMDFQTLSRVAANTPATDSLEAVLFN